MKNKILAINEREAAFQKRLAEIVALLDSTNKSLEFDINDAHGLIMINNGSLEIKYKSKNPEMPEVLFEITNSQSVKVQSKMKKDVGVTLSITQPRHQLYVATIVLAIGLMNKMSKEHSELRQLILKLLEWLIEGTQLKPIINAVASPAKQPPQDYIWLFDAAKAFFSEKGKLTLKRTVKGYGVFLMKQESDSISFSSTQVNKKHESLNLNADFFNSYFKMGNTSSDVDSLDCLKFIVRFMDYSTKDGPFYNLLNYVFSQYVTSQNQTNPK